MAKGNKTNHPRKFMRWDDWQSWYLKEWLPFRTNDFPHLVTNINNLKRDMVWQKGILIGMLLVIVGAAVALILVRGG